MKSPAPDLEAQETILVDMSRHVIERHQREAKELKEEIMNLQMALSTYLLVKKFVHVPASEEVLRSSITKNENLLLELFTEQPAQPAN